MKPKFDLSLYLVTDPGLLAGRDLKEVVLAAVRGGVTIVQLRDKDASDDVLAEQARMLLSMLRPLGVPLIINDRVEVARWIGADGVHVGQDDTDPRHVRERMGPDAIVGLSANTPQEFAAVPAGVVDYLGVGPVFATSTKPDHDPPLGLEGLAALARIAPLPTVAIGGIGLAHAASVRATGVNGLAVVSAICAADDPEDAARRLAGTRP